MAESVVAGALIEGRRILLCHRSPGRRWYPEVWDLPGGHEELGETPTEALERELLEELCDMGIWFVGSWNGMPANLAPEEHDAIAWFTADELTALEMAHPSYLDIFRAILKASPN